MRKFVLAVLLLLAFSLTAAAQDEYSKGEFFLGYSYLHIDTGSDSGLSSSVPAGFNLDGTYYPTKHFGLVADFQFHKKEFDDIFGQPISPGIDARVLSMHFGPRFKARSGKVEPFVHALFGFTNLHLSAEGISSTFSDTAFSMKLGGGLDVVASPHFAIRLGEFNYYYTKFESFGSSFFFGGSPAAGGGLAATRGFAQTSSSSSSHQNNFTYSAGIVFRF